MQKKYEVIRLVKQNASCHMIMDYVEGEIFAEYLSRNPQVEKGQLFTWIRQIAIQLGELHSVKGIRAYRYVTPFCIIIKRNKELMLLDINAKSNQYIMSQIGREEIRKWFFPVKESYNDIYSFGKTMQYLLAKTRPSPGLSLLEERKLKRIISKCLSENSKKQYQKFTEILLEFPKTKNKEKYKIKKGRLLLVILAVVTVIGAKSVQPLESHVESHVEEQMSPQYVENLMKSYIKMDTPDTRKRCMELGEEILQEKDIKKNLETEIRKMLAEVYEKEGEYEKALREYEVLNQWICNEEIYRSMLRLTEEEGKILELCERGIRDNPKSTELRIEYIKTQCKSVEITKESCEKTVRKMVTECPELLENSEFQKLQSECGILIEGESIWVEK